MPGVTASSDDTGMTRRTLLESAGVAAAVLYLPAPARTAPRTAPHRYDDDYWAFADRMQAVAEPGWSAQLSAYCGQSGTTSTLYNATLLYTHAAAATAGRSGPCRQDERARLLVSRLCASPPWRADLPGEPPGCPSVQPRPTRNPLSTGSQEHACGWGSHLDRFVGQHVMRDTMVVRALAQAHAARDALGLSRAQAELIRDRIGKAANSAFYAYPSLRLNQINWPLEIYAHAAEVLGSNHLLRHDCRLQLGRFADALTRPAPGMRTPNTGPGYRFHYLPQSRPGNPINLDSAEYATIVCGALLFYGQAEAAGMAGLRRDQLAHLRAWVERVLCQQALLAIALTPRFQPTPAYGRWARYLFDRGLALFDRLVAESEGLPPAVMFGVERTPGPATDAQLAVARAQANAARACMLGLSRVPAEQPPPLYAYDPDVGRLAITTPAYNTAIVPVTQGAFPYGAFELARLFDGDQRVAANIGGRPPAAVGVVVRDRRSGRVTTTQRGLRRPDLDDPPLRLVEAPRGTAPRLAAYPRHAYAGPFRRLEVVGTTRGPGMTIRTRHRFTADSIQTSWRVLPDGSRTGPHDVRILFPSTGDDVVVTVVLRDGRRLRLTRSRSVRLADVAWLHLGSRECGYVVVVRSHALPGTLRLLPTKPQSSAPHAGPTVAFELLRRRALRELHACVRIAPARDLDAATAVAGL
jgi:hypothetical protein